MTLKDVLERYGITTAELSELNAVVFLYQGERSFFEIPCRSTDPKSVYEGIAWMVVEASGFESRNDPTRDNVRDYMKDAGIHNYQRGFREYQVMKQCAMKLRRFFGNAVYQQMVASKVE